MVNNRQSFMTTVKNICPADSVADIEVAYLLAKISHKGQFRKELDLDGNPLRYFEHVKRVALNLIEAGVTDPVLISAALLHDTIEDSDDQDLINALIIKSFSSMPKLHSYIQILTKIPKTGYTNKLEQAAEAGNPVILVKMADRLDNLSSLPKDDLAFQARQLQETAEQLLPVFTLVGTTLDKQYQASYEHLLKSIWHQIRRLNEEKRTREKA